MILRSFFSFLIAFSLFFLISSCSSDRKKDAQQQQKSGAGGPGARPPARADAFIVRTKLLMDNIEIPGTLVSNETTEIHP